MKSTVVSLSDLKAQRATLTAEAREGLASVDPRACELAHRLVAPGPKACGVSASECHEIAEYMLAVYGESSPGIVATQAAAEALIEVAEAALAWRVALDEREDFGARAYHDNPSSITTPEHRAGASRLDRRIDDCSANLRAALAKVSP